MKNTVFSFLMIFGLALSSSFSSAASAQTVLKKRIAKTHYCSNMKLIDEAIKIDMSLVSDADYIVVSKSRRLLYLLSHGRVVKAYDVAFGFGAKSGPKIQSGDGRTPEGLYSIESKNPASKYHLSLKISYPEQTDIDFALKNKVDPGSDIMIHGFPGGPVDGLDPDVVRQTHPAADWTRGCIAVTDHEIEEIFSLVKNQVSVEICPLIK